MYYVAMRKSNEVQVEEGETMATNVELLKPKEVSRRLGLCKNSVYTLLQTGQIPSVRIGRAVRISSEDLARFIESRRSPVQ